MMSIPTTIVPGDKSYSEHLLHVATSLKYQILLESKTFKERIPLKEPEYPTHSQVTADEWVTAWQSAEVRT
ncbi:hypothetical protein AVU12_gp022 [Pseudomonas phage KPP21]|uniref:Uncharacterized protein n=1 Tax=Pseudomonas phage KPP21 TaxID=1678082 RepID=A0A0H5AXU4_BPK21|nr:hypothetical protein AVU12_gp022 [Pseudomonas phage KPP21]BAR94581.1 hypothetical protein [Pseudomonas phage KPP21]